VTRFDDADDGRAESGGERDNTRPGTSARAFGEAAQPVRPEPTVAWQDGGFVYTQPATVTVVRNHADDVQDRQMIVWLDGELIATLMFGQGVTRDLEIGRHRLRISNTLFWKTVEFDVKAREQVRFEIINRAGLLTYPMLALIGAALLYVAVQRVA
jgi:hypothetical protein